MEQPPHMMPRRRSAFDEEFDMLKQIQETRMAFRDATVCHDRCIKHFWVNKFYLRDKTCMQNCLEQMNQVTVITNIAQAQFEEELILTQERCGTVRATNMKYRTHTDARKKEETPEKQTTTKGSPPSLERGTPTPLRGPPRHNNTCATLRSSGTTTHALRRAAKLKSNNQTRKDTHPLESHKHIYLSMVFLECCLSQWVRPSPLNARVRNAYYRPYLRPCLFPFRKYSWIQDSRERLLVSTPLQFTTSSL
eukprot:gene7408-5217_t